MAGRLTAQSKEVIASVSEDERQKGLKLQMFLGELPRPEEFQNDRWSEQDGLHGRAYTGKVSDRGRSRTTTNFLQKVPYLFHFSSYFLHSHIKKIATL